MSNAFPVGIGVDDIAIEDVVAFCDEPVMALSLLLFLLSFLLFLFLVLPIVIQFDIRVELSRRKTSRQFAAIRIE